MNDHPLISFVKTPKVVLAEYLHRLPQLNFQWKFCNDTSIEPVIQSNLAKLQTDGITILPSYFHGNRLANLQSAFELALANRGEEAGNPGSLACFDIMDINPAFLAASMDKVLLEIIARYYRKSFGLGRADALRIEPLTIDRYGSFQWHHDSRGKQLKVQILLTDVPENGQRMTYLKQSHTQYYSYRRSRGDGSRFELDLNTIPELEKRIINVTGPAGTVAIFDTNGLHSGNRNNSARRDVITFYYPTKESRNYAKLSYRKNDVNQLDDAQRLVVTYNPLHQFI